MVFGPEELQSSRLLVWLVELKNIPDDVALVWSRKYARRIAEYYAIAGYFAGIHDKLAIRYQAIIAYPGFADDTASPVHYNTRPDRWMISFEIRSNRAVLIDEEIIRITSPAQHGSDRMLHGENIGQLNFMERIEGMKGFVQEIGLGRRGMARVFL